MRILVTGVKGQLGQELLRCLGGHEVTGIDLPDVDITDRRSIAGAVQEARAELVIHCAAYTDVDGCAHNPQLAYQVNGLGTQNVALACLNSGAKMVHVSTNEVFAGTNSQGYLEWMPVDPQNAYARSKAAAEFHVRQLLTEAYIVRTAWAYAAGGRNFVHAILKIAHEKDVIRVVTDEIGNPTYMRDVAAAIATLIETGQYGTYHFVNEGSCSRWAFANEILRLAGLSHVQNVPILSSEFRRASTPPPYGALRNVAGAALGIRLRSWQEALKEFIELGLERQQVETGDLKLERRT
ncbi:MAG TPA: dTDP-4-dehydrorhamnose reductase [Candidatus Binatia bacterium]|nr:dTDP-4-dehydrorhamnose reductase [Candidatus Binatia bacterium]